jgi:hypothetical protein
MTSAAKKSRSWLDRLARWSLGGGLLLALLLAGAGCRIVQQAANVPGQAVRAVTPGKSTAPAVDPVELQQTLLRFTDEYTTRMYAGINKLQHGTNAPDQSEVLQWKIAVGSESCAIASGPNPVAGLLDMTIFVTVTRIALEEHWVPDVFGDSARPLLENCRISESNVWQLANTVLTPAQQTELRQAIAVWYRQNPLPESILAVRAVSFATLVSKTSQSDTTKPGSVFGLLMLDPLSGLDPALQEITQTRLFAERALYVTQKMPVLLRWQTELLALNTTRLPAFQQVVSNSTEIASTLDRYATIAEKLPGQVSTEREAILQSLHAQEKEMTGLLASGTQMSDSLNTTLTTFDALMKRFGVGEPKVGGPPPTNAEPFRIQDYTQTAAQLEATARQLNELLLTLDQTLGSTNFANLAAQVAPVLRQAHATGQDVVNDAFWKGLLLVAAVLLAALGYRFLAPRLAPKTHANAPPNSP